VRAILAAQGIKGISNCGFIHTQIGFAQKKIAAKNSRQFLNIIFLIA
jgi:hypothetical protein